MGSRGNGAARTVLKLGALGLFGVCAPAEWGGAGADFLAYMLMTEELAYGDAGICNMVNAANSSAPRSRLRHARPEGALPAAGGERQGAGLPADDRASCRVRRGGDAHPRGAPWRQLRAERRQVLHHVRALGGVCGDLRGHRPGAGKRGLSAFLTRTDRPGYRVVRLETKLGHRSNDTCQIALEDLEVPAADLLGQPGDGLRIALAAMDSTRVAAAAQAIGVARAAHDAALAYARERQAFGKPIIEHQAVAFRLAEMATEIEVARQMCHHVARLKSAGVRCVKEASMAKLFASQMSERVCSAAIQIHGGYGYVADFPVEKYYRDARVFQIYDGTNEVQKILISRELAAGR